MRRRHLARRAVCVLCGATQQCTATAIVGGRLFPYEKNYEGERRPGAVFDVPDQAIKAAHWTNSISRILDLLSRNPDAALVPEADRAWLLEQVALNSVGPLFVDAGTPASFAALTVLDNLPQLVGRKNPALYYKHKENTYSHVTVNHCGTYTRPHVWVRILAIIRGYTCSRV